MGHERKRRGGREEQQEQEGNKDIIGRVKRRENTRILLVHRKESGEYRLYKVVRKCRISRELKEKLKFLLNFIFLEDGYYRRQF